MASSQQKNKPKKTPTTLACLAPLLLAQILGIGASWAPTKTIRTKNIELYWSVGEYILVMEEILYPVPLDMSFIPLFTIRFICPRWCRISSINSTCLLFIFSFSFLSNCFLFAFLFIFVIFGWKGFSYQEWNGMEVKSSILDNPVKLGAILRHVLRREYNSGICFRIYVHYVYIVYSRHSF